MRTRLLANEAALADYEILEMLLFLGIPRRDTKPLAKSLVNRFGSLAAVLAAPPASLRAAGLPPPAIEALGLAVASAESLARPEQRPRPILDSWDALERHLDPRANQAGPPFTEALLLDSRNRLVAQPRLSAPDPGALAHDLLRQALRHHASAVILVRHGPADRPAIGPADRAMHDAVTHAAAPLTVVVHDLVVTGQGHWISLRRSLG